jgi:hypothetical protein
MKSVYASRKEVGEMLLMYISLYSYNKLTYEHLKLNSVVLVRKRTIPTKRPQPADEVSANFS